MGNNDGFSQTLGKRMSIRALAILLLASCFPAHAATVPLQVGGTTVLFPAPEGHVAISKRQPKLFEYSAAALPPSNRLVESFYTPADVDRVLAGDVVAEIYYQVQALRAVESRELGSDDWTRIKSELIASMPKLDMDELIAKDDERSERMSKVIGEKVEFKFADVASPKIFRETPTSVTYGMILPITLGVGGETKQATLTVAAATLFVRNRLLYVFAYSSDASPSGIASLHRSFDATVDEMVALNASDPDVESTGGVDWKRIAEKGMIGALIGAVIGLFGWWMLRRRRG